MLVWRAGNIARLTHSRCLAFALQRLPLGGLQQQDAAELGVKSVHSILRALLAVPD